MICKLCMNDFLPLNIPTLLGNCRNNLASVICLNQAAPFCVWQYFWRCFFWVDTGRKEKWNKQTANFVFEMLPMCSLILTCEFSFDEWSSHVHTCFLAIFLPSLGNGLFFQFQNMQLPSIQLWAFFFKGEKKTAYQTLCDPVYHYVR